MHTATNQPSETANSTPPQTAEEVLAQLKTIYRIKRLESEVTMVAAQTKAMETLMACMTPIQTTGDTKLDAFYARERNRQRLAAIQTLLHIRTVQRESAAQNDARQSKSESRAIRAQSRKRWVTSNQEGNARAARSLQGWRGQERSGWPR
ncbi:MAG: hypothetical protein ACFHWZ_05200 [Phycisphaerales bacterium]